jgi:zinc transporter ZupT
LLPQAQKEMGWKSTASLLAGILLFMAANILLPHEHGHQHGNDGHFEESHAEMGHKPPNGTPDSTAL